MTAQMNTDSGLYIALAGGVGVLSGAIVSAILETIRDARRRSDLKVQRKTERDDALAMEDRQSKRDAYVQLIGGAADMRNHLLNMIVLVDKFIAHRTGTNVSRTGLSWELESWQERSREFESLTKNAFNNAHAFGSASVKDGFDMLASVASTYVWTWFTDSHPDDWVGAVLVRRDQKLRIKMDSIAASGFDVVSGQLLGSLGVTIEVCAWLIKKMRVEIRSDVTQPPDDLPYGFSLYDPA